MTELVQHQHSTDLTAEMDYARTIAGGAILPAAYRGKPADILIATGLGKAIGIAPAQSLYEIYVVNGRPSPSANLMAALVRRAGHKLRVKGDAQSCTATLIRSDDPDEPFEATWTIEQARDAKLTGKDTWKQYPAAMLRARAVAEVVRMGASECVLGMDYSAEEMRDVETPPRQAAPAFISATTAPAAGGQQADEQQGDEQQGDDEPIEGTVEPDEQDAAAPLTDRTRKAMFALINEIDPGATDDAKRAGIGQIIGRTVESRATLTEAEGQQVVDHLRAVKRQRDIEAVQSGAE